MLGVREARVGNRQDVGREDINRKEVHRDKSIDRRNRCKIQRIQREHRRGSLTG